MPRNSTDDAEQSLLNISTPREIFRYRSSIRLLTETASFEFDSAIPPEERRAILLSDPGWRVPWPPSLSGVADQDDLFLALSRIVAMLSLRPGIAGSTAAEVRSGLFERFPSLPQALDAASTEAYRRFAVEASLSDDPSASWQYFEDTAGLTLPGTEDPSQPVDGKVGVEIFIQNVLRVDLLERIEKLRPPGR